jgi:hypothetical protein
VIITLNLFVFKPEIPLFLIYRELLFRGLVAEATLNYCQHYQLWEFHFQRKLAAPHTAHFKELSCLPTTPLSLFLFFAGAVNVLVSCLSLHALRTLKAETPIKIMLTAQLFTGKERYLSERTVRKL